MLRKCILAAALICSAMLVAESGESRSTRGSQTRQQATSPSSSAPMSIRWSSCDSCCWPALRPNLRIGTRRRQCWWRRCAQPDLTESEAAALTARLAVGKQGSASYECGSELVATRLSMDPPSDWVELHKAALADIGIAIVTPDPPADARLEAVRTRFRRSSAGTGTHAALHGADPAALVSDGLRRLGRPCGQGGRGAARGRLFRGNRRIHRRPGAFRAIADCRRRPPGRHRRLRWARRRG